MDESLDRKMWVSVAVLFALLVALYLSAPALTQPGHAVNGGHAVATAAVAGK